MCKLYSFKGPFLCVLLCGAICGAGAGFRGSWGRSRRGPVALRAWAISGMASGDPGRQVVTVTAAAICSGVELVTISGRGDGQCVHASGVGPSGVGAGAACDLGKLGRGRSSRRPWAALRSGACLGPGPVLLSPVLLSSGPGAGSAPAILGGVGVVPATICGGSAPGPVPWSLGDPGSDPGRRQAAGGRGAGGSGAGFSGAAGRTLLPPEIFRDILPGVFFGPLPADQIFRAATLLFFQNFSGGWGKTPLRDFP